MIIIKYLGKTVKGYLRRYQDVPPKCEESCPDCHGKLYKHGRYYRFVITVKVITRISFYRRFCPSCGKTFSLLPMKKMTSLHPHNILIMQCYGPVISPFGDL